MTRVDAVPLDAILPLRTAVLRDGQPPEAARFDGDHDADALHLAAFDTNEPDQVIGCLTLLRAPMPRDTAWTHRLRGMAVAEDHQNRGVGAALLIELKRRTPELHVWCTARQPAQRFYERHGWATVGDVFDVPHHGPHVTMTRSVEKPH